MPGHTAKPVLGYPTQTDAVEALSNQGLTPKQAAERTGIALQTVYTLKSQARKRAGAARPPVEANQPPCHAKPRDEWCDRDGPGGFMGHTCYPKQDQSEEAVTCTWMPSKIARARRIVDRSMVVIADALSVPLSELLRLVRDDLAAAEDERIADEAALAAMAGEDDADTDETEDGGGVAQLPSPALERPSTPVIEPAPKSVAGRADPMATTLPVLLKLKSEAGDYLHEHERGMTRLPKFIWRGTADEVKSLKRKKPHLRPLIEEPC